jgi:hypothetical protein
MRVNCPVPIMAEVQTVGILPTVPPMGVVGMEGPISIKEILAQLDGEFPMDEAVIEGDDRLMTHNGHDVC